jgi:SAM-dependent methyltransferase
MIDRAAALPRIAGAKLDVGCGARKRTAGHVGIDVLDLPGVDIVGDARDVLAEMPADCISEIYCSHFLEHVEDVGSVLREMSRVLAPGGAMEILVPHFSNPYYHSDPTHRHTFGLYSFCYWATDAPLRRAVPTYGLTLPLRLTGVELVFKAAPPHYGRYAIKRMLGAIFNSSRYVKEFYEENLCYLVPCYEVRYLLRAAGSAPRPVGSNS